MYRRLQLRRQIMLLLVAMRIGLRRLLRQGCAIANAWRPSSLTLPSTTINRLHMGALK